MEKLPRPFSKKSLLGPKGAGVGMTGLSRGIEHPLPHEILHTMSEM